MANFGHELPFVETTIMRLLSYFLRLSLMILGFKLSPAGALDPSGGTLADRVNLFNAENARFYQDQAQFAQLSADRLVEHLDEVAYLKMVNDLKHTEYLHDHMSDLEKGPYKFYKANGFYVIGNLPDLKIADFIREAYLRIGVWERVSDNDFKAIMSRWQLKEGRGSPNYVPMYYRVPEWCQLGDKKGQFACAQLVSKFTKLVALETGYSVDSGPNGTGPIERKPIQDLIFNNNSKFPASLFSFPLSESKNNFFQTVAQVISPQLAYSGFATSILFLNNGRFQCYSGTMGFLFRARQSLGYEEFENRRFVVIFTLGHMLPGFIENRQGRDYLVGLETTVNGRGLVHFGSVEDLDLPIRIVDANLLFHFEASKNRLDGRAVLSLSQEILKKTADYYRINLNRLEQKVAALGAKGSNLNEIGFGEANPFESNELANSDSLSPSNYSLPTSSNPSGGLKADLPKPNWFPTTLAVGTNDGGQVSNTTSVPQTGAFAKKDWWGNLDSAIDRRDAGAIKDVLASNPDTVLASFNSIAAKLAKAGLSDVMNAAFDLLTGKITAYEWDKLKTQLDWSAVSASDRGAILRVYLARIKAGRLPVNEYLDCLPCLTAFFEIQPEATLNALANQQVQGFPVFVKAAQGGVKIEILNYLYEKLKGVDGTHGLNMQTPDAHGNKPYCIAREAGSLQIAAWFKAHGFFDSCPYKVFGIPIWTSE